MGRDGMKDERLTERRHPGASALASFSTSEILELMNDEDARVAAAVRAALPQIAHAVDTIVTSFANGGRLRYVGAGTSGRLAALDAAECPPTFNTDPKIIRYVLAGGPQALGAPAEFSEDSRARGRRDLAQDRGSAFDPRIPEGKSARAQRGGDRPLHGVEEPRRIALPELSARREDGSDEQEPGERAGGKEERPAAVGD